LQRSHGQFLDEADEVYSAELLLEAEGAALLKDHVMLRHDDR
jgi:hypothetical protein